MQAHKLQLLRRLTMEGRKGRKRSTPPHIYNLEEKIQLLTILRRGEIILIFNFKREKS